MTARLSATVLTGLLWFLCLSVALASLRFLVGGIEATMGFVAYHLDERALALYTHILMAPLALALAPVQLWAGLRKKRPHLHRFSGRIYGVAVLLGGVSGLWLATGTSAGPVAGLGFGLLAIFWLVTTGRGIQLAILADFTAHRRWMIRSIALSFSAVTLRLYIPLGDALGFSFLEAYTAIAWLCWVPNLLAAELILLRKPLLSRPATS